eukprot:XP_003728501.1 PREDICTED: RNA polymerase-associated protein LEO1 [Strongylocentrotus purpuratus]
MTQQGDFNHFFIRQGTGLQGLAVFRTKLSFRPHSTDSATHRKMTLSMADRCSKTQKIKVVPISGNDPEAQRGEMIKREEERLRASLRRQNQQRRIRERSHQRGLSAGYLEPDREDGFEEEDDSAISLSAIKKNFKSSLAKVQDHGLYSSDEEEVDRAEKLSRVKALYSDSDDDSDSEGKKRKIEDSDDEDQDEGASTKKKKRVAVLSDDDDDESD